MNSNYSQWWSEIDVLESQTLGMFVGGMLLDTDVDALSRESEALTTADLAKVTTLIESMGATKLVSQEVESIAEMKKEIKLFFENNAEVAMMAARSFESLPDETVKTIYTQLLDLREKANKRG